VALNHYVKRALMLAILILPGCNPPQRGSYHEPPPIERRDSGVDSGRSTPIWRPYGK
jgi:hypothetical protein